MCPEKSTPIRFGVSISLLAPLYLQSLPTMLNLIADTDDRQNGDSRCFRQHLRNTRMPWVVKVRIFRKTRCHSSDKNNCISSSGSAHVVVTTDLGEYNGHAPRPRRLAKSRHRVALDSIAQSCLGRPFQSRNSQDIWKKVRAAELFSRLLVKVGDPRCLVRERARSELAMCLRL